MWLSTRCATAWLVAATIIVLSVPAGAQERFELQPEYVHGKNRKPRIGYRKPEVFDPLSDQLYQAGYRDFPPTAIPDELRDVDAMTRVKGFRAVLAAAAAAVAAALALGPGAAGAQSVNFLIRATLLRALCLRSSRRGPRTRR